MRVAGGGDQLVDISPLVGGEVPNWGIFWNLDFLVPAHLGSSACGQHVVTILHWVGALVSIEQLRDMHQIVICVLSRGTRSPVTVVLIISCLSLLFGTLGRPTRSKDMKGIVPGRAPKVLLGFSKNAPIMFYPQKHSSLFK